MSHFFSNFLVALFQEEFEKQQPQQKGEIEKKTFGGKWGKNHLKNVSSFFLNFYLQILSQILPEE